MKFLFFTCIAVFAEQLASKDLSQNLAVKPPSCVDVPHFLFSYNSTCDNREQMSDGSSCESVCAETIVSECSCMMEIGFIYFYCIT